MVWMSQIYHVTDNYKYLKYVVPQLCRMSQNYSIMEKIEYHRKTLLRLGLYFGLCFLLQRGDINVFLSYCTTTFLSCLCTSQIADSYTMCYVLQLRDDVRPVLVPFFNRNSVVNQKIEFRPYSQLSYHVGNSNVELNF